MKRLLTLPLLVVFFATPLWAQVQPSCGVQFSGADNSNRPLSLFQNSMSHWSTAQPRPTAFSVSAGNLTGNGTTSTATVGSDPTVGTNGVRLYVGMPIVVAGMSDAGANGNFLISALTSTTIAWLSSFNGTTGGGTVTSRMVGADTAVFPTTTGNSWTDPTTGCVFKLQYQKSDFTLGAPGQVQLYYASRTTFSLLNTYFTLFTSNFNDFISATATPGNETVQNFSARLTTFSKADDDYAYSMNGNTLRYTKISTAATVSYTTFGGGLTNCKIGGEEGGLELIAGKDVIPFVCDSGSNRAVFSYTINDRAASSPSGTQSCVYTTTLGAGVDNSHINPATGDVVVVFSSPGSGNNQGIGRVDTSGGTCAVTHLNDTQGHGDIATAYDSSDTYFVREINNTTTSCTTQGVVAIRLSDGAQTCILDRSTANAGTGSSNFQLGGHVSGEAPGWVVISNYDSVVCRTEAGIGSAWDTNIKRTSCGVAVCQVKASPTCWWLGNPKGATHSASGDIYWKMWKAAASSPESGKAAKSVPQYILITTDGKDTSTTSANEALYTALIDFTDTGATPTLASVSPDNDAQGATVGVTLTGTNLGGSSPSVSISGSGVTVQNLSTTGAPTSWTADFVIAGGAATGARDVTATTSDGTSNSVTFTVNAAVAAPTLSSISPSSGWRGAQILVTFTGTGLDGANPVLNSSCADVTFPVTTPVNSTTITAQVLIGAGVPNSGTTCTFSVSNDNGTSGTQTFTVNSTGPIGAPRIVTIGYMPGVVPTVTVTNPDQAADPFCASATAMDCIFEARILSGGVVIARIPAADFINGSATATLSGGSRYGTLTVTARFAARAPDGSVVESDDSDPASVDKKPGKPVVRT